MVPPLTYSSEANVIFLGGGYSCKTEEVCVSVEMEHSGRTVITVIGHGSACPTFPVVHQFPMIAQW